MPIDTTLKLPCDVQDVSDGYHTFRELYEHRHALFLMLIQHEPAISFKSRVNKDGSTWEGWFVAWIEYPNGQISYHLPERYWDQCNAKEKASCDTYDGHTSQDICARLLALNANRTRLAAIRKLPEHEQRVANAVRFFKILREVEIDAGDLDEIQIPGPVSWNGQEHEGERAYAYFRKGRRMDGGVMTHDGAWRKWNGVECWPSD